MVEDKIKELGYILPETPKPLAAYIPAIKTGDYVYTSGQVPFADGELKYSGKIGFDLSIEEGQKAAELCALNALSAIKSVVGDLNKIEQIIKVTVFVNSADAFTDQPKDGEIFWMVCRNYCRVFKEHIGFRKKLQRLVSIGKRKKMYGKR